MRTAIIIVIIIIIILLVRAESLSDSVVMRSLAVWNISRDPQNSRGIERISSKENPNLVKMLYEAEDPILVKMLSKEQLMGEHPALVKVLYGV